jgi:hypothetical protein
MIRRRYCYSCEEYKRSVWFEMDKIQREPRALTRCECAAKLEVQCCEKTGIWFVNNFIDEHNHDLTKHEHSHILRSHQRLSVPQKVEAVELALGGLRTSQIMDVMEKNHGGPECTRLRSHQRLSVPQTVEAVELALGGLRTSQIMDVMEKNHSGPECTGFLMHDIYNFFIRQKKEKIEGRDAASVLPFICNKVN